MKRIWLISLLLLLAAVCMPLLFLHKPTADPLPQEPAVLNETEDTQAAEITIGEADAAVAVTFFDGAEVRETTLAELLPLVVSGEMPASFETQALRAQAVAARTYILRCMEASNANHPEADVCGDPGCCVACSTQDALRESWGTAYSAWWSRICQAVTDTDGQYLVWEGEPIQAVFHSSSDGATENGADVWSGAGVPYLVSVSSPETEGDVPNYRSEVSVSAEEFAAAVRAAAPEAELSDDPGAWLGETTYTEGGAVARQSIGGTELSGIKLRSMFSLRSASFELGYADGSFIFSVTGYGHGVGMSQYGANTLAAQGWSYEAILAHYYPGTTLLSPEIR